MRWAVLLAGGSGTRFWPLSTPQTPKQLLPLSGAGSTAEEAVERLTGLISRERILVVAGEGVAPRLRAMLSLPAENFLIEPRAASTAPALIWATWPASRPERRGARCMPTGRWGMRPPFAGRQPLTTARTSGWLPSGSCLAAGDRLQHIVPGAVGVGREPSPSSPRSRTPPRLST
jgi:hypothetical protein